MISALEWTALTTVTAGAIAMITAVGPWIKHAPYTTLKCALAGGGACFGTWLLLTLIT